MLFAGQQPEQPSVDSDDEDYSRIAEDDPIRCTPWDVIEKHEAQEIPCPKPGFEKPSNDAAAQPIAFACPFSAAAVAHRVCILLRAISASFTRDTGRRVQVREDSLFKTARDALPWYEDALRTVQSAHSNGVDDTTLVTAEPGRYLACLLIVACKPSLMIPDCHCAGCHVI